MTAVLPTTPDRWPFTITASVVGSIFLGVSTLALGAGVWRTGFFALWALPVVGAAVEDAYTGRLRDVIVLRGLGVAVIAAVLVAIVDRDMSVIIGTFVGAVLMSGWFLIVHLISPHGLGFGDVKFAALIGCGIGLLTPAGIVVVVAVAAALQAIVTVGRWLPAQRAGIVASRAAPFGPSLALASFLFIAVLTAVRGGVL